MINPNVILEINKKKIIQNYKLLSKLADNAVGATIKANAYGLGDLEIFKILYKNGCRHFFVASLNEAISIRKKYKVANLYVLNGLENNNLNIFNDKNIIPIINSKEELIKFSKSKFFNTNFKLGIQIETGLNRLGISLNDLPLKIIKKINVYILLSHFSSSEELKNRYNNFQNDNFKSFFNLFKSIRYKSLCNSAGIINNNKYHYDILRPGISLYGGYDNKIINRKLPINPVIKLKAKILQIKIIKKNNYVGYNQTYKTIKNTKVAILGIGYADGYSRILSNLGSVFYKNKTYKVLGRVSMDSITIDITSCKDKISIGKYMEIINYRNDIQNLALKCNTINREILTSISQRVKRVYV